MQTRVHWVHTYKGEKAPAVHTKVLFYCEFLQWQQGNASLDSSPNSFGSGFLSIPTQAGGHGISFSIILIV